MQAERTYNNVNVIAQDVLMTPAEIKKRLPITLQAEEFVLQGRETLQRIIDRQIHACLWWWDRVRFMTCERPAIMRSV